MKIAIIYGGKSGEHEVSLVSAASVVRNIEKTNSIYLIGITKDGRWFLQPEAELKRVLSSDSPLSIDESVSVSVVPGGGKDSAFMAEGKTFGVDVVFPVLHGTFGEDGTIQGLLEMADVPYVGGGVMASSASMDKEKTKVIWKDADLPVVPYVCARKYQCNNGELKELLDEAENKYGYPLFVKPCCAGSSVGASKASDRNELESSVKEAFQWDSKILIEQCIDAREIECSVIGNSDVQTFIPGEIVPTHEFYDYDAKYNDPDGAALCIPAKLDMANLDKIQNLAEKAYRALDLSGLSRVDFFVDKTTGSLYINEVNTIPGFTSISMFPKMCENGGLEYKKLIEKLLSLAIERFNESRKLKTSR